MSLSGRGWAALTLAVVLLPVLSPCSAPAADSLDELQEQIDDLRLQGRYADALDLARVLSDSLSARPDLPEHERVDDWWQLRTLERASGLSADAQSELAEADNLTATIFSLWGEGRYAECLPAAERQLVIRRRHLGSPHPEVASTLGYLARLHKILDHYPTADSLSLACLDMRRELFDEEHPAVLAALSSRAMMLKASGDYAAAEPLLREVLAGQRRLLGDEDPGVAESLNNLALVLEERGKLSEAEELHRQAGSIYRLTLDRDHNLVATNLGNLGLNLYEQGRYTEAEPLLRDALEMNRRLLGEEHPAVAYGLNNLAGLLEEQGDYAAAGSMYEESLALRRRLFGDESLATATGLDNLAGLRENLGDLDTAEEMHREALAIRRKLLDVDHPTLALSLNNLAFTLDRKGDHDQATALYREALAGFRRVHEGEHIQVATVLGNLAVALDHAGDAVAAEQMYRESLAMRRRLLGDAHPDVARNLHNLALFLTNRERLADSGPLHEEALRVQTAVTGRDHPLVARILGGRAEYFRARSDYAAAARDLRDALGIYRGTLSDLAAVTSERQILTYSREAQRTLSTLIDLTVEARSRPALVRATYLELVRTRGSVFDHISAQRRTAMEGASLGEAYSRLVAASERLAFHVSRGPARDAAGFQDRLRALRDEKETAEREVARSSARLRERLLREETEETLSLDGIFDRLPRNSVLVNFVRYRGAAKGESGAAAFHDAAFVLNPTHRTLELLTIGPSDRVDALVTAYQEHMAWFLDQGRYPDHAAEEEFALLGRKLYDLVVAPLGESFTRAELRLVIPDGSLTLINLGTLIDPQGSYLMETAPIHLLSSVKDLARLVNRASGRGLLALGNPDFSATENERRAALTDDLPQSPPDRERSRDRPPGMRVRRAQCGPAATLDSPPLPGSEDEVQEIARLFEEVSREAASVASGAGASEDWVKRAAPGRRLVHLATHGFYLQGLCPSAANRTRSAPSPRIEDGIVDENPMLLSGLLLSGASLASAANDASELDDGVLTAAELSTVDLSACDWLVLSACETALGRLEQGEGVYGLRRAAQLAGARTVIASMFPVPDQETRAFMLALYRTRLRGETTATAMQSAMSDMMSRAKTLYGCRHPVYWGGFVAVGGWD